MAGDISTSGYKVTEITYLSTELNSLADGANKLGAAIDNSTNKYKFIDVEISLASAVFTTNPHIIIYVLPSIDDTNYVYGSDSIDPEDTNDNYIVSIRAVTAAQRQIARNIEVPPGKYKLLIMSEAGVALASSGNTVKYRPHNHAYT